MAARYGGGATARGRKITGDDMPLYAHPEEIGKGLVSMDSLKQGAKVAGFNAKVAGTLAAPKVKQAARAATATPGRKALTAGVAGAAVGGAAMRPAQPQPIYVAPYSQGFGKGWESDLSRAGQNAARKAKLREGAAARAEQRQRAQWAEGYPGGIKRLDAEDDFDARSNRKARNFVERFGFDQQTGARRLARPGLKTSLPRGRSLSGEDKRYLGLPGGTGSGTRQGHGAFRGGESVDYQLTGNRRVRKAYRRYDPERNRQRRAGAAEATLAIGGGYAAHRGVRGIQRDTKALRETKIRGEIGSRDTTVERKVGRKALAISRRNGLLVGGGLAAIGAAGGVGHWQNSNRGRTYR